MNERDPAEPWACSGQQHPSMKPGPKAVQNGSEVSPLSMPPW